MKAFRVPTASSRKEDYPIARAFLYIEALDKSKHLKIIFSLPQYLLRDVAIPISVGTFPLNMLFASWSCSVAKKACAALENALFDTSSHSIIYVPRLPIPRISVGIVPVTFDRTLPATWKIPVWSIVSKLLWAGKSVERMNRPLLVTYLNSPRDPSRME